MLRSFQPSNIADMFVSSYMEANFAELYPLIYSEYCIVCQTSIYYPALNCTNLCGYRANICVVNKNVLAENLRSMNNYIVFVHVIRKKLNIKSIIISFQFMNCYSTKFINLLMKNTLITYVNKRNSEIKLV